MKKILQRIGLLAATVLLLAAAGLVTFGGILRSSPMPCSPEATPPRR